MRCHIPKNLGRDGARPSNAGERVTRLELATSSLARRCSTTELHPRKVGSNNRSRLRQRNIFCESAPGEAPAENRRLAQTPLPWSFQVVAEECCESLTVAYRNSSTPLGMTMISPS